MMEKDLEKKNEEKTGDKDKGQKSEEVHRIVISNTTDEALESLVERVNNGFDGGKVNRSQVANWALARFEETVTDAEIKEIRADHFDDVSVLESILRRAKKTGQIAPELKALLQKQMGLDETPKKRTKKNLQNDVTNDYIDSDGTR